MASAFTRSEMERMLDVPNRPRSTTPFKLAGAAALAAAALDYPLTQKYPLKDEAVSLPMRLAVTGGLVFVSVLLAAQFVDRD